MDKIQWVKNFINEVVDGWMLSDLERLSRDIPHIASAAGNCNFPIALYTFACIEFLGQLTLSTPLPKSGYTQSSIMGYIDNYFPDNFKSKLKPYESDFVNIFRHGLAHNYFAKYAGISRTDNEPFHVNSDGMLILDADHFATAFSASILNLKKVLNTDFQLVERIFDRYNDQYHKNLSRYQRSIIGTRASGASLAHPSMIIGLTSTSTSTSTVPSPITLSDLRKITTTMPLPAVLKKKS